MADSGEEFIRNTESPCLLIRLLLLLLLFLIRRERILACDCLASESNPLRGRTFSVRIHSLVSGKGK